MRKTLLMVGALAMSMVAMAASPQLAKVRTSNLPTRGASDVITEAKGDLKHYIASEDYFYLTDDGDAGMRAGSCVIADMVFDNAKNEAYWRCPLLDFTEAADSYIKGRIVDNKIIFQFPQMVYYYANGVGDEVFYNVQRLKKVENSLGELEYFAESGVADELTFVIADDGTITCPELEQEVADGAYPQLIMGLAISTKIDGFLSEAYFGVAGGYNYTLKPFEEKFAEIPDGIVPEKWALTSGKDGRFLNVFINGNDIFIGNWNDFYPESYVKGTINGDKVLIPGGQYLGRAEIFTLYNFLDGASAKPVTTADGEEDYEIGELQETIELSYDAAKKVISAENYILLLNAAKDAVYCVDWYYNPRIELQGADIQPAAPADPTFVSVNPYNDMYGYGNIVIDMPKTDVNGNLLDTSRLFYNIYLDAEEILEFWDDEYYYLSDYVEDQPLVDVPYNFSDNDYDFIVSGIRHMIYVYSECTVFGCKMIYVAADGKRYESNLVSSASSVEDILVDKAAMNVVYYDLAGRKVANPDNGIYLKSTRYEDGSVRTVKAVCR